MQQQEVHSSNAKQACLSWCFYGCALNADVPSCLPLLAWHNLERACTDLLCQDLCSACNATTLDDSSPTYSKGSKAGRAIAGQQH